MRKTLPLAALAALALGSPLWAADPQVRLPDFSHLHSVAVDAVDVSLDGTLLRTVQRFAKAAGDEDPDADAALGLLADLKAVQVRSFRFDRDGAYSRADLDGLRRQLDAPGWSRVMQKRRRDPQEDVDVYLRLDGGKASGLVVIASEPREFTVVNVVGNIDVDKLARLEGQFGIPRIEKD
jgi:hypothetical protein